MASDASSTLSWQTLFWTLMPLATNVMTQPSGRVLSLPSRYHTYLRSSPIICLLDALAFLLRIFITPCLLPISLHQGLETTIRERYKEIEDASEGIQSLEKQIWLRWVFFIIGTLGPGIKLMAMQGVPWTKAWGVMFLVAFLVAEAAALFARRSTTTRVYSSLWRIRNSTQRQEADLQVARLFESVEKWGFYAGSTTHCAVLLWAFLDLWTRRAPAYFSVYGWIDKSFPMPGLLVVFLSTNSVILIPVSLVASFLIFLNDIRQHYRSRGIPWSKLLQISFVLVVIGGTFMFILLDLEYFILRDSVLFSLSACSMLGFIWVVKKLSSLSPRLGETLLIASGEEGSSAVGTGAVNALTLCISNVVVCVLWYWLRYDPEGTVNPSWTGVFG